MNVDSYNLFNMYKRIIINESVDSCEIYQGYRICLTDDEEEDNTKVRMEIFGPDGNYIGDSPNVNPYDAEWIEIAKAWIDRGLPLIPTKPTPSGEGRQTPLFKTVDEFLSYLDTTPQKYEIF